MPLKLVPPRPGKTPYWYVRGSYLGRSLDRSTKAVDERIARRALGQWKADIERGAYVDPRAAEREPAELTFLAAAVSYMKAGGERKFLSPIIEMTGPAALVDRPVAAIDQAALDTAADALYPRATAATRNRQFYTPVTAVLHHAGVERRFKRPKGWRGKRSTSWLTPAQAFRLFAAADAIDAEFGLFCRCLLYTGMRLGEALAIRLRDVHLDRAMIYLPETKNGEARAVHLPPPLVATLAAQPPRPGRPRKATAGRKLRDGEAGRSREGAGVRFLEREPDARLFRFHAGSPLRAMLAAAKRKAGITLPRRQGGFHVFCHTYGTWMSQFGSLDTFGLTRTGRWADPRSADRYRHTATSEESRRADLLPAEPRKGRNV